MSISNKQKIISANNFIIAENEQKVYDAGYAKGLSESGYADGVEAGKKAERESFWDRFLLFKKAPRWSAPKGVFHGIFWGFDNFYPTKDIIVEGEANYLFYNWATDQGGKTGSLKQRLEECGVRLDTSKATSLTNGFAYCTAIKELPTIDCTGLTNVSTNLFRECYSGLESIEKIIVHENQKFNEWFAYTSLKEVRFEGVIGEDIKFDYGTRLSRESIINIVEHLSEAALGKTLTLTEGAVNNAFTSEEWAALIANKTNWTFSLV